MFLWGRGATRIYYSIYLKRRRVSGTTLVLMGVSLTRVATADALSCQNTRSDEFAGDSGEQFGLPRT
jgi:hypothetical protein